MSTKKQFHKLLIPGVNVMGRGASTIGGTVIGDYLNLDGRVIVVEMPKVEKKAGKKAKKVAQATKPDVPLSSTIPAGKGTTVEVVNA